MAEFFNAVLSLAARFNFSTSSWIRTEKHNRVVGGSEDSLHLLGLAMDVVLDPGEDKEAFIRMARRLGLIVIDGTTYIHLQVGYPDAG